MEKIKCECGHVNPQGTVLCEACGKPIEGNQHLDGNDQTKLLNMRYEGSARRSQTYTRTFIDKVWMFFSSVKVGIWLIIIALVASALGTIFPLEVHIPANAENRDPAVYYEAQYGFIGKLYYMLGIHQMYDSLWYKIIIGMLGISLVICSIDRFVPLYRALKMQRAKRHKTFVSRQRLFSETEKVDEKEIHTVVERLKKKKYNVRIEEGHVLAEKGRFSRWGPYVNHIGLIIILIGALLRVSTPMYLNEYVWVREDERVVIPGTDGEYYIENKSFTIEVYDAEEDERFKEALEQAGTVVPKNYQSDVIVYRSKGDTIPGEEPELELVTEDKIRMNEPLKFAGYSLYQAGYQTEFNSMTFKIYDVDDPDRTEIDSFTVENLMAPDAVYELESGFRVEIEEYFADYYLDDTGPRSESRYPRNPAFVFLVYPPGEETPEISFIGIGRNVSEGNQYQFGLTDFSMKYASGLEVVRDYTLPVFGLGALIFMIGLVQGMYWQHRRIWLHPDKDVLLVGAHTNKNWFGLKKDIEQAIKDTKINMVEDFEELDNKES